MSGKGKKVAAAITPKEAQTLIEFARAKRLAERRASCAVCALPDEIRTQIKSSRGKMDVLTILDWLSQKCGIEIDRDTYKAHGSAQHDQKDE